MFQFNFEAGATTLQVWAVWILVFVLLFVLNEATRRYKYVGLGAFTALPIVLTIMWFTILKDQTYTDWFHLAKVYSSTAGCIGFWALRHVEGTNKKTGKKWRLIDYKAAKLFPPLILGINILEAVVRDFQVGIQYLGGAIADDGVYVVGGVWNYMNGVAGILNIIAITGWAGITIRKMTKKDTSKDMLWPDMLWFWIIAYDLWNFAYTYNCLPTHSWYCGFALLFVPTLCAFTIGKGGWLQHRAQTLALWCMFAQTFPAFLDKGKFAVSSTNNPTWLTFFSAIALAFNIGVIVFMIIKVKKTKRNPYKNELYTDLAKYKEIAALAE